jgi:hypothetical protein
MNINDAFPSKYLKASDLPDEGSQAFTIERIEIEEIGRDKDRKPVIYFEEGHKGLVCNKTNARTIAKVLGSEDFEDWTGKSISLFRAEVDFQGEMIEAIRVRTVRAKQPKSVPLSQPKSTDVETDENGVPF